MIGHSQGGHAAIAAQSYAKSYGMSGKLVGIAVARAAVELDVAMGDDDHERSPVSRRAPTSVSILLLDDVLYGAGELRDPGHGLDIFETAKRTAAKEVINGAECYDATKMQALGATPADFFDPTYVQDVGYNCATNPLGSDCTGTLGLDSGSRAFRRTARPIDTTSSAPILALFGGKDTVVTPSRAQCARNKIRGRPRGGTGRDDEDPVLLRLEGVPPQHRARGVDRLHRRSGSPRRPAPVPSRPHARRSR